MMSDKQHVQLKGTHPPVQTKVPAQSLVKPHAPPPAGEIEFRPAEEKTLSQLTDKTTCPNSIAEIASALRR